MSGDFEDEVARLVAEADQARKQIGEFAGTVWSFYERLTEEGFTAEQAMELCNTFLASMALRSGDGE